MPRDARRRILLIFLIIRYTGAKLNEVLNFDPNRDFDFEKGFIILSRQKGTPTGPSARYRYPQSSAMKSASSLPTCYRKIIPVKRSMWTPALSEEVL
jgi:molybdate transport system regulatory protein